MPLLDEPIKVKFGTDEDSALNKYVWEQLDTLMREHKTLFDNELPEWRRTYEGTPKDKEKNWPWKNASNLVIQITATYVDQLLARVLAAIFEVQPLWVLGLVGDWPVAEQGEEQRKVLEEYLNLLGHEPEHLALYRNEYSLFHDAIKYGLCVLYAPLEQVWEEVVSGYSGESLVSKRQLIYEGVRLDKVEYENFMITPKAKTLADAEFKAIRKPLTKYQLDECVYKGIYERKDVDAIKDQPDRYGADLNQQRKEEGQAKTTNAPINAEWDIYECWFPYIKDNKRYRLIVSYHFKTKKVMRAIFNWYPENKEPMFAARLGYEGGTLRGKGYAKIMKDYQAEISTIHNQDIDGGTLANTNVFRVDPASRLDANLSIYPSAILPFKDGEFEAIPLGRDNSANNIQRQHLVLELARDRAGVAPPMGGSGSGVTNPRKGVYSSMGTFSIMQEGNRRTNINITDFRLTHMLLGRYILRMSAEFGAGKIGDTFGTKSELLKKALDNVKKGRMTIPVHAATASVNREVEKQNDMLLVGIMKQHYQWVGAILQSLPQAPEHMKDYILKTILGADLLMKHILRNFGHDDVGRFVPEANIVEKLRQQVDGQNGANGTTADRTNAAVSAGNAIQQINPAAQGNSPEGLQESVVPGVPSMATVPSR